MKNAILLLSAITLTAVLAFFLLDSSADAATPAQGVVHRGCVVAEVMQATPTSPVHPTICYVNNTSMTEQITLGTVTILGPGGRSDVIAVSGAHAGTVVEPLGRYEIVIDDSIPGLVPQTSLNGYGARSAIIEWTGGYPITVELSSEFRPNFFRYGFVDPVTSPGYDITP